MWTVLVATVLHAAPLQLEVMGFSVEREGPVVTIVVVKPGSPAATMGLEPGMTIERLVAPTWLFVRKPLGELNDRDLHDALTPPTQEALVLQVKQKDSVRVASGLRTDAAPDPWLEEPMTKERFERLSTMQLMRFNAWQGMGMASASRTPAPRTALSLAGGVVARVAGQQLVDVSRGGWTRAWVYSTTRLAYACESSPMRTIELSSESEAPIPKVAARSSSPSLQASSVEVELPLWRTADVLAACAAGKKQLASVPLNGFLGCEGKPREAVTLGSELELVCGEPPPQAVHRHALYLDRESMVVGERKPIKTWWWSRSPPTPRAVSVVELDRQRKVVRRVGALSPADNGEWLSELVFDATTARTLALAVEVSFPDGTVELGDVQPLRVLDKATDEKERAEFDATMDALDAVSKRLFEARPKYCDEPKGTVRWLQAQPEVAHASATDDGHSISFIAKPRGLPMAFICHAR